MNHYEYVDKFFKKFVNELPVSQFWKNNCDGLIVADGDKCYGYKSKWEKAGIPFGRGVAIYLLGKIGPYSNTVRDTPTGFVPPVDWVVDQYTNFKTILEKIENE